MTVLLEMAVDAMHAPFEMDIFEVDCLVEFLRIIEGHRLILRVQQGAFAIVPEYRAEDPAMAMEVGKLRVLESAIKFGRTRLLEEIYLGPQAPNGRALRIARLDLALLYRTRMTLLNWPHLLAIHFVVPPGISKIGRHHVGARVDVANHALARGNRSGKLMADRMARLVVRNGRVLGGTLPQIAVRRKPT